MLAQLEHFETHEGVMAVGNGAEIRPHQPVENMRAQDPQGLDGGIDGHRRTPDIADGIDQKGDEGDVVEVRMGHEDVVDAQQLIVFEFADTGSAINEDVIVDQKGRGARLPPTDATAASQHPEFHDPRQDRILMG